MTDGYSEFDRRVRDLDRKKAALREGARAEIDESGLVELRPVPHYGRNISRFIPWKAALIIAAVGLGYKGFLMSRMGDAAYASRLEQFSGDGVMDRAGRFLMQTDPVSTFIADQIRDQPWKPAQSAEPAEPVQGTAAG
ncbi:hypothetical protein ACRARG_15305 [Pseudooceanicola sp. C21-150M6]|uniref:hypothetical protein n=1 Tax=Pseudooceanicola sp. C21-150M6 TaxID=3434355 RepID=UPI003D7FEDFA